MQKTCFSILNNKCCTKTNCRYWINEQNNSNCVIICSNNQNTLHDIGRIIDTTRFNVAKITKNLICDLLSTL